MERKNLIGIGVGVLLIAGIVAGLVLFGARSGKLPDDISSKIKEAEIIFEKEGVRNAAGLSPKYEKIEVEYFYKYDDCLEALESAMKKFGSFVAIKSAEKQDGFKSKLPEKIKAEENELQLPIAVLSGNAELFDNEGASIRSGAFTTVINGLSACSEKILVQNLCNLLEGKPETCGIAQYQEKDIEWEKSRAADFACYGSCSVSYISSSILFSQIWQGPPCSRISSYIEGESKPKHRECKGYSCKNDTADLGCCTQSECVDSGKCYAPGAAKDIGGDGQAEICMNLNNEGVWADADLDASSCQAGFRWFGCINEDECRHGLGSKEKKDKKKGLCCGDDKGENPYQCKGKICASQNDYACCPADSCVFNGKCYQDGCSQLELGSGEKIGAFCNGAAGQWVDLDEGHCAECLGKDAWSGTVCCGDDEKEGKYNTRFIFNSKNGTSRALYYACTAKKSDCVYPYSEAAFGEGFYAFKDDAQYMQGGYYCKSSQWYGLDTDAKYCRESGFSWDKNEGICCGDNSNEFYIKGADGSNACCSLPSDSVEGGKCRPTTLCGNSLIDTGELCELPGTKNNEYCSQSEQQCLGNKLGARSAKGYCNSNCLCQGDDFAYSCAKGSCGASCGNDSDCGNGEKCDIGSCSCKPKAFCGDNIVQGYNDLGQREECELPNTESSKACKIEECKGRKSASQFSLNYGSCTSECKCDYSAAKYGCKKNACGAECSDDGTGCDAGMQCNTDTCSCFIESVCGNGICEGNEESSCPGDCSVKACASRIELKFDKNDYYLNEVIAGEVRLLDENGSIIPEAKFELDLFIDGKFIRTSTYSTGNAGVYTIKKSVNSLIPKGIHKYIAKSKIRDCKIVSDTRQIGIHVDNQYAFTFPPINSSRFDLVIDAPAANGSKDAPSRCGNDLIEQGEACEGSNACRASAGCDYQNKIYDFAESCSSCSCPDDKKSSPNDEAYCSNCKSCGDGKVNCGEECEGGEDEKISSGLRCRSGKLYERFDSCSNCRWVDDNAASDILVDSCECKCPQNPKENCMGGNYINYTQDYSAGCSNEKCSSCNCMDTYTKDSDNDKTEDKCEPELCGNKIDDNDNGFVDEEGCIWYYCSQCGYGLYKLCTRQECAKFEQGCFFSRFAGNIFGIFNHTLGGCNECSKIKRCEEYKFDSLTCESDPCSVGNCISNGGGCCTDNDNDKACDSKDNCPGIPNPGQENSDKDPKGDACETCIKEPALFEPREQKETGCYDEIDDDCDGLKDCRDPDCAGKGECCQSAGDCVQGNCATESCINNRCVYKAGYLCYNAECPKGSYCDIDGKCKEPDSSESVCLYCSPDATKSDYGVGYGSPYDAFSKAKGLCCGDDENEYYIVQRENKKAGCCGSSTSCVDDSGGCHDSNSPVAEVHSLHCLANSWHECSSGNHALCSEAGSSYMPGISYKASGESGWYCTYDAPGMGYGWRKEYPKEACSDNVDNDCDAKTDLDDEDCAAK